MEQWNESCLICGDRFFSKHDMNSHVQSRHYEDSSSSSSRSPENIICPFCPFEAASKAVIDEHLYSEHVTELQTPEKGYSSKEAEKACDQSKSATLSCPLCGINELNSPESLKRHVNEHFLENEYEECNATNNQDELVAIRLQQQEEFEKYTQSRKVAENLCFQDLQNKYGMTSNSNSSTYSSEVLQQLRKDVGRSISPFDYYSKQIDVMEKLEQGIDDGLSMDCSVFHYIVAHLRSTIRGNQAAFLCAPVNFIGRGAGDAGWGCGYRNIQMLVSSINKHPHFADIAKDSFKGNVPSIRKIQESIEIAWNRGHDVQGCNQLGSKLVNTKKWIGATEAFTYFAHRKFHARIVDFEKSVSQPRHELLLQWLMEYFEIFDGADNVTMTNKLPLYFQHDGHSRTILGIVTSKVASSVKVTRLIVFDPGISSYAVWKKKNGQRSSSAQDEKTLCIERFLKPISDLSKRQYQVVSIAGVASESRMMQQKDVDSICEKIH